MGLIYVDHAATSPVHPKVIETMLQILETNYGNPSSIHQFGREARQIVDNARHILANSIRANDHEIVFTSGGTEANNTAIIGTAFSRKQYGKHLITTEIEHPSVLHTCQYLEAIGFDVTYLPVDAFGKVKIGDLKAALREDTILVSIMYGNNEVGSIQPIVEIGHELKQTNISFHTDAVQACGLIELDVQELGVDLLSVSAHKINGPKGIGFLYIRDGLPFSPVIRGGKQERMRRAGTENVVNIAGFGKAVELSQRMMEARRERYMDFQNELLGYFQESDIDFLINSSGDDRLPHILNVSFPGISAEMLLVHLDLAGIAASSGSACTAGSFEPSHVLAAMFPTMERAESAIRFSFGYGNKHEELEKVAFETIQAVKRLKE